MDPIKTPASRCRKSVAPRHVGQRVRGFTMVEAMVTLAIAGILTAVAAPSLNRFILNNQRTTAVNDLVVSVQLARSEAVRRGRRVAICPSNGAGTDCIDSTDWKGGWIVYAITGDDDEVIRSFPALETVNVASDEPNFIYPPPTDVLGGADAPNLSLWTVSDSRGPAESRYVDVLPSGRPRVLCPGPSPGFAPHPCT